MTPEEQDHYQKALDLYALILENVEQTAESVCNRKDVPKHLNSARIGCLTAWVDSLTHMLNDVQIEALKQRMKIVVDRQ